MALTATLTPEYIDEPKSAKGPYSVRGKDGPRFKIWPDKMDGVEKGKPIKVTYEEKKNTYNGKEYIDNVVSSVAAIPTVTPGPATNGHAAPINKDLVIWVECILGRVWKDKIPLDGEALFQAGEVAKDIYYRLFADIPF